MSEEVSQTSVYPPLSACVLVDSSFKSRKELLKDLNSSRLFQNVIEAGSLDEGANSVAQSAIDACVLGPSVSRERATAFIAKGAQSSSSPECAFVVAIHAATNSAELNDYDGAHGMAKLPCSRVQLADTIINAVVKANANSPWRVIREKELAEMGQLESITTDTDEQEAPAFTSQPKPAPSEAPTKLGAIFSSKAAEFARALAKLETGIYTFKMDGTPSMTMQRAVHDAIEKIFPLEASNTELDNFKSFLATALVQWLRDLHSESKQTATTNLRNALAFYLSRGPTT